jgi:hypothetical protein
MENRLSDILMARSNITGTGKMESTTAGVWTGMIME